MSGLLQALAGILIVFFLPGYMMVNMLFPRRNELDPEYDVVYRSALGMGLSVVIAIIIGFSLNAISSEDQGYVSAGPLWTVFLAVTALFFAVGWYRGAYPSLGLLHPALLRRAPPRRVPGVKPSDLKVKRASGKLVLERERLMEDLKVFGARSATSNPQRRLYYQRRMELVREQVKGINAQLDESDEEAS